MAETGRYRYRDRYRYREPSVCWLFDTDPDSHCDSEYKRKGACSPARFCV